MEKHDLLSVAFPKLNEAEMASLGACPLTELRKYAAGEKLFQVGDCDCKFFVVKSGEIEIVDASGDPSHVIAVHKPGEFTGEIAQLTGSPALVEGVARRDSEVYELSPDAFRQLLNHHPDLGDRVLQAFIARRQLLREPGNFTGLRVIGSRYSQDTFRIREFLAKNLAPFTWLDLEADGDVNALLKRLGLQESDTPVVALGTKVLLRNPSNRELADALGLRRPLEQTVYDLVVVGAGPAGLAAAVYGASEGLRTVVLEQAAPGGQAGRSMRIENYLGFPTGITGGELAERAAVQVNKFGARLSIPSPAIRLSFENHYSVVHLEGNETVTTRCLLIATGADYRLLQVEGVRKFEGRGVYYAATRLELQMCLGAEVIVVGGGNSAGQAAVFLAGQVLKVYIIIRGDDLSKNMSSYLVQRIEQTANIEVIRNTELRRMLGGSDLEAVEIVNKQDRRVADAEDPRGLQLYRRDPANRLAARGDRKRPQGFRENRAEPGAIAPLEHPPRPLSARNQPPRRVRRGGCAVRLHQASRIRRR